MSLPVGERGEATMNLTTNLVGASVFNEGVLTHYQKLVFFERLNKMVLETREYDGQLSDAWASAEVVESPRTPTAIDDSEVDYRQRQQINSAVRSIRNAGISSVAIEAAHVYMYEDLADPALRASVQAQSRHAAVLTQCLKPLGIDVRHLLFVDNYNPPVEGVTPNPSGIDLDELLDFTSDHGFVPELIFREADMVPLAKRMIEVMRDSQGLVIDEDIANDGKHSEQPANDGKLFDAKGRLLLTRRNLELYRPSDDMVTCAMLDAALTAVKLRHISEGVVNILPTHADNQGFSYKGQQRKMRTILGEHLQARVLPVFNIFSKADEIAAGAHHAFRKRHTN